MSQQSVCRWLDGYETLTHYSKRTQTVQRLRNSAGSRRARPRATIGVLAHARQSSDDAFTMQIQVRLFAALAEAAGTRTFPLDLPEGAAARDVRERVAALYPRVRGLCDRSGFAVNAEYVPAEHRLAEGDEVALIPPVSGG